MQKALMQPESRHHGCADAKERCHACWPDGDDCRAGSLTGLPTPSWLRVRLRMSCCVNLNTCTEPASALEVCEHARSTARDSTLPPRQASLPSAAPALPDSTSGLLRAGGATNAGEGRHAIKARMQNTAAAVLCASPWGRCLCSPGWDPTHASPAQQFSLGGNQASWQGLARPKQLLLTDRDLLQGATAPQPARACGAVVTAAS